MNLINILIVCFISFIVSIFGVFTGGVSLITVPMLVFLGMTTKNAVATNMFALIFLSISGAVGFRREMKSTHFKMIVILSLLTICGSLIGANLVLTISEDVLKKIIAFIICVIAGFFLFKKNLGIQERKVEMPKAKFIANVLLIFILGIYGGFFSGGYVTLLSYILISTFGLNFLQTAFVTKIFNIFSSLTACTFFCYHGLIDFRLGIPLAFSMSLGAFFGAKLAITKGNLWVRNLFIIAAIALAIKLLFFT